MLTDLPILFEKKICVFLRQTVISKCFGRNQNLQVVKLVNNSDKEVLATTVQLQHIYEDFFAFYGICSKILNTKKRKNSVNLFSLLTIEAKESNQFCKGRQFKQIMKYCSDAVTIKMSVVQFLCTGIFT